MALIDNFVYFINGILAMKIIDNITLLDILVYLLFIGSILGFIKIAVKTTSSNNKYYQ